MKIIHLANLNSTNIGNGALIYGTERVISEDLGIPVEFVQEAWDDYTFGLKKFDESFVDFVNSSGDALLINGAVTFNIFRKSNKNTGMRFDLPLNLWDKIKVPIIFYGNSYRAWPAQIYENREYLRKTIEFIIGRDNILFAVRNDGTKEWLEKLCGFKSPKIYEVPDPGLYAPASEQKEYPEIGKDKKNIVIAFNNEDDTYRFGGPMREFLWKITAWIIPESFLEKIFRMTGLVEKRRGKFLKHLARFVENLAMKYPKIQFILAAHYLDDYSMIGEFISILKERVAHQFTVSTGLLKTEQTPYFYGRYRHVDLVLAMRIHSMSPAIGIGAPVIPLTYPGRMTAFLERAGLSDIQANIFDSKFEKIVFQKAVSIIDNPVQIKERLALSAKNLREKTKMFNSRVLEPFLKETGRV